MYPNPGNGEVNIRFINGGLENQLMIYNALGQLVLEERVESDQVRLTMEVGTYFVRVQDQNGIQTHQLVITR